MEIAILYFLKYRLGVFRTFKQDLSAGRPNITLAANPHTRTHTHECTHTCTHFFIIPSTSNLCHFPTSLSAFLLSTCTDA